MKRPLVLGLTGSIGMGKSTTAEMFGAEGVPVWDADAAVHRLYAAGGAGVRAVAALCPAATGPDGVDRQVLNAWLQQNEVGLQRLEAAVHPLVAEDRAAFLDAAATDGAELVVLDIPLLFETGADRDVDATLVVTASPEEQRRRVLSRPGMTEASLAALLSRQMPDAEKRDRADHVIETRSLDQTRADVRRLLQELRKSADA